MHGKSAPEKMVPSWWLRQRTAVGLRWVTERLRMGHFTPVSQAVNQVNRRPQPKHERLKCQLSELPQPEETQCNDYRTDPRTRPNDLSQGDNGARYIGLAPFLCGAKGGYGWLGGGAVLSSG